MKQLDEAAEQQASEQQSKFVEKELRAVQRAIRQTKTEENALSRQINSLLLKPLVDVVLVLKELKRLREEKVKGKQKINVDVVFLLKCRLSDFLYDLFL